MNERRLPQLTAAVLMGGLLAAGLTGSRGVDPAPRSDTLARQQPAVLKSAAPGAAPIAQALAPASARPRARDAREAQRPRQARASGRDPHYEQIRRSLRWLPVRYAGTVLKTPDARSRLLLARSAAQRAGLQEVGLSHRDVYGIINAETSWIPRTGASRDGTPNLGIAQFEPATARAVGLKNPHDPVEAVHAMALHLKDAAAWSARRIAGLQLTPQQRALKLREGVSIYYNLSTKGRNKWNGRNTAQLPAETQRHILNARRGAVEAARLEAQLRELQQRMQGGRTVVAGQEGLRS